MEGLWAKLLINNMWDNNQELLFESSDMKRQQCKTQSNYKLLPLQRGLMQTKSGWFALNPTFSPSQSISNILYSRFTSILI